MVTKEWTRVGRSPKSDVVVEDTSVSRDHAAIERRSGFFWLTDKHSRNGTKVNGIAIVRRSLREGDHVMFGNVEFVFSLMEEEVPVSARRAPAAFARANADEPMTQATRTVSDVDSQGDEWMAFNAWRVVQRLGETASRPIEESLRCVAADMAGIYDVRRVLLFLAPGIADAGPKWIRESSERLVGREKIPEEAVRNVASSGEGIFLLNGHLKKGLSAESMPEAVAVPLKRGATPCGCLYVEADEALPPTLVKVVQSAAEALSVSFALFSRAAGAGPALGAERSEGARDAIIGASKAIRDAMRMAEKAAASDAAVLLRGETGTGKELFARLIVRQSKRSQRPFLPVHCSAIEETLMGSTLFGHEKGSFTGAVGLKKGVFEVADGGTVFLDEVGELTPGMQVKLLRVLQEGEFMRVGGTTPLKVDVRIVAATNRDLEKAIREGTFREDLFYRLSVIGLRLPPLRERPEDIPDLVRHFLDEMAATTDTTVRDMDPDAMERLKLHRWPGNIRELRNMIERGLVLAEGRTITVDDLPEELASGVRAVAKESCPPSQSIAEMERDHIDVILAECKGNKRLAAQRLGISRSTLYEKLKVDMSENRTMQLEGVK